MRIASCFCLIALACTQALSLPAGEASVTTIDVLIVTSQELGETVDLDELRLSALGYVEAANAAYKRCGIPAAFRLVGCARSSVRESSSLSTVISRTASNSDVAALRAQVGADLVSCWVSQSDDGLAVARGQQPGVYTALDIGQITNRTLVHELSHNLGASHEDAEVGTIMYVGLVPGARYFSEANASTIRRHISSAAARMPPTQPSIVLALPSTVRAGERISVPLVRTGSTEHITGITIETPFRSEALSVEATAFAWIPMQAGDQEVRVRIVTSDGGEWVSRFYAEVQPRPSALGSWRRSKLAGFLIDSGFDIIPDHGWRSWDEKPLESSAGELSVNDNAHLLYVPVEGDCEVTMYQPTTSEASGIMIRPDLRADSPHIVLGLGGTYPGLLKRSTAADFVYREALVLFDNESLGRWWRLRRHGDEFTAWHRPEGSDENDWSEIGRTTLQLPHEVLVGVFQAYGYVRDINFENETEPIDFAHIAITDLSGAVLHRGPALPSGRRRLRLQVDRAAEASCWAASGTFPAAGEDGSWSALYPADTHILRLDGLPEGDG